LEAYREMVVKWVKAHVEVAAIRQRLMERGYTGSYASVWRFVQAIKPRQPEVTVRVETPPGAEAQADFGYAGRMIDPQTGRLRKAWAFVMTLSWSRHQYVEFVWDQKVETFLRCHRNAFEFFDGVTSRVRIDNLKAAILKAVFDDPQVQQSYRECAEHYGYLIAPCRVATPEHKGKVEQGGVHYVVRNFLGGREPTTITQANRDVLVWCNTTAGLRLHGTTQEKPLERFKQVEKAHPESGYDLAVWKHAKVYRDCYVTFDHAFYSVPYRLYPGKVWICGGSKQVRIFDEKYHLVATHERATHPGQRLTHLDHLPPEKVPGLILDGDSLLAEAEAIGPALLEIVQALLNDPLLYRLPTAGRLVRLKHRSRCWCRLPLPLLAVLTSWSGHSRRCSHGIETPARRAAAPTAPFRSVGDAGSQKPSGHRRQVELRGVPFPHPGRRSRASRPEAAPPAAATGRHQFHENPGSLRLQFQSQPQSPADPGTGQL